MKLPLFLLTSVVVASVWVAEFKETFDATTELPADWNTGITGSGIAKWEVVADNSAPSKPNALRQSGEATFAWAIRSDHPIQDGFVEVKIKPISGREDQAGGIVWRFKDSDNYYVSYGPMRWKATWCFIRQLVANAPPSRSKAACSATAWIQLCPGASGAGCRTPDPLR